MKYTLSEKILARASDQESVRAGDIVKAKLDAVMLNDATGVLAIRAMKDIKRNRVWDPSKVVVINDHVAPACTEQSAKVHKELREWSTAQGLKHFYDVGSGVCHQLVPEVGLVYPGGVIVGADSHTTTYGAFGCFATGVGSTDAGAAMAFGKLWFKVPETINVVAEGKLQSGVTPKDVILKICGELGADGASYMALEFTGSTIHDMTVAGRMTLCNMAIEVGGKAGLCEPDQKVSDWVKGKAQSYDPVYADDGASYCRVLNIDAENLEPLVACPHNVDNVKPVSEVKGLKVNQVFIGSCTNGRLEDLEQAHSILKGMKVSQRVRVLITPASRQVYYDAERKGILHDLMEAGCIVTNPSCAACFGGSIGILAPGEVCLSTSNRNFKGRQGSPEAFVYLGSALTAAASALKGELTDPREVIK